MLTIFGSGKRHGRIYYFCKLFCQEVFHTGFEIIRKQLLMNSGFEQLLGGIDTVYDACPLWQILLYEFIVQEELKVNFLVLIQNLTGLVIQYPHGSVLELFQTVYPAVEFKTIPIPPERLFKAKEPNVSPFFN